MPGLRPQSRIRARRPSVNINNPELPTPHLQPDPLPGQGGRNCLHPRPVRLLLVLSWIFSSVWKLQDWPTQEPHPRALGPQHTDLLPPNRNFKICFPQTPTFTKPALREQGCLSACAHLRTTACLRVTIEQHREWGPGGDPQVIPCSLCRQRTCFVLKGQAGVLGRALPSGAC